MAEDARIEIDIYVDNLEKTDLDSVIRDINLALTKLLDDDVIDDFDIANVDST